MVLVLLFWSEGVLKILSQRISDLIIQVINNKGVCRTTRASPSLSKTCHLSCVACHISHVTYLFIYIIFLGGGTKLLSQSKEYLFSTGPTPPGLTVYCIFTTV